MSNQSQEQIVIRRVRDFGNADHEKTDRIYENLGINIDEHDTERLKSVCRTRSYNPTAEDLVFFDRLCENDFRCVHNLLLCSVVFTH